MDTIVAASDAILKMGRLVAYDAVSAERDQSARFRRVVHGAAERLQPGAVELGDERRVHHVVVGDDGDAAERARDLEPARPEGVDEQRAPDPGYAPQRLGAERAEERDTGRDGSAIAAG